MALRAGDVIHQRYQVVKHLGSGGMASVYQVWDRERAVHLALKMLRPELARSSDRIRLFQREAHHLESLSHPHIVRFYEMAWEADEVFLLMEYIDGQTLREEMDSSGNCLAISRIREILPPICTALYYAHRRGIIHCDLKPSNVLIDRSQKPYVSDFGISQLASTPGDPRSNEGSSGAGTPAYMAPEQARHALPCPSSDLYSLGILLYEVVSGKRPFDGKLAPASILQERDRLTWEKENKTPPLPSMINPQVPTAVDRVIMRCLNPDPRSRYSNALELSNDFEKAFASPVAFHTASVPSRREVTKKIAEKAQTPPQKMEKHDRAQGKKVALIAVTVALLVFAAGLASSFQATLVGRNVRATPPPTVQMAGKGPGTYPYLSACMTFDVPNQPRTQIDECVESIEVLPDGQLKVHVRWTVRGVSIVHGVTVGADTGNRNMYLTDDQGNRIDHIATGEGADLTVDLFNGESKQGWFLFPAPRQEASSFIFHDDDNGGETRALERLW